MRGVCSIKFAFSLGKNLRKSAGQRDESRVCRWCIVTVETDCATREKKDEEEDNRRPRRSLFLETRFFGEGKEERREERKKDSSTR